MTSTPSTTLSWSTFFDALMAVTTWVIRTICAHVWLHTARGRAAAWTACRLPVVLVFQERFPTEDEAVRREIQLKGWSRAKKQSLIDGDFGRLKALSRRRVR